MKSVFTKFGQASAKNIKAKLEIAQSLRDLFENELKNIYWAEKTLLTAFPRVIKNVSSPELLYALSEIMEISSNQIVKLETIFTVIGKKLETKRCEAMEGLLKETEETMVETEAGTIRDAGIILAFQKIEHYEIATYGTLTTFAKTLREETATGLLEEILQEKKDADSNLSQIAQSINNEASAEEDD